MATTAASIQSDLDSTGYAWIPQGTHSIDTTITLNGERRMLIRCHPNGELVWAGSTPAPMFQINENLANFEKLTFQDVWATSTVSGSPIVGVLDNLQAPHELAFDNCRFEALGAYCIDMTVMPYVVIPTFRNMRTAGSGALRWRARTGGADSYHTTSQTPITGWYHDGDNRVGPAFDLRGTSGLRMRSVIDTGSPSLLASLRGFYEGPLSFRIDSCRTPGVIQNYTIDYIDEWSEAANCWLHEFRTESGTGPGLQEHFELINVTLRDANSATTPVRIMGGPDSKHSLVVDITSCQDPSGADFQVGGKCWVRIKQPWYTPGAGQAALIASAQAFCDSFTPGFLIDPIVTDTDRPPGATADSTPLYQAGAALYDDWLGTTDDYEVILGG